MTKLYIHEFYIKNSLTTYIGFVLIALITRFIIHNFNLNYQYLNYGLAITIAIISATVIGYLNAKSAFKEKNVSANYLHFFIIIVLFITDCMFGKSSFKIHLTRELSYFLCLQLGVYLFSLKKKSLITKK